MKKVKKALWIATLLFIALACKKEDPVPTPEPQERLYEIVSTDTIHSILEYYQALGSNNNSFNFNDLNQNSIPFDITLPGLIDTILSYWGSGIVTHEMYYESKDVGGQVDQLSGRVFLKNDTTKQLKGIILSNHFTCTADTECPSNKKYQIDAIFSTFGYAVVMPDYIGYGVTVDDYHPYLDWASTAQASIDAYLAAKQYLEDSGYDIGNKVYNIGYSQGGEAAMAVLRKVTENYPDKIQFTRSFMGGGIYNIEATFDDIIENNYTGIPYAIPLIMNCLNNTNHLNISLQDLFIGITRDNYSLALSKQYTTTELEEIFTDHEATKIFSSCVFDKTHPTTAKILEAAAKNDLNGTWKPKQGEQIFMLHSINDDYVPFINSELMSESLEDAGCSCELVFDDFGGHVTGAMVYYMYLIGNLLGWEY